MKIQQNDVHESILPTEGTKTGCFCAHTRVHTERDGKLSMLLTSAFALNKWSLLFTSWKCFKTAQKQVYKKKYSHSAHAQKFVYFLR